MNMPGAQPNGLHPSQLGRFLDDVDNTPRIHSSMGSLTPAEFEQQWLEMPRTG
jgi:transposase InsO family protein